MNEMDTIELLRHSRHDWLNKIQLISGYISLGKTEKVKEIISDIIYSTQMESKLSNLGLPHFATYLLTYNWKTKPFIMKYEIIGNGKLDIKNDYDLVLWLERFQNTLLKASDHSNERTIFIQVNVESNVPCFIVHFHGILIHKELINEFLQLPNEHYHYSNLHLEDQGFTFQFHFKDKNFLVGS